MALTASLMPMERASSSITSSLIRVESISKRASFKGRDPLKVIEGERSKIISTPCLRSKSVTQRLCRNEDRLG